MVCRLKVQLSQSINQSNEANHIKSHSYQPLNRLTTLHTQSFLHSYPISGVSALELPSSSLILAMFEHILFRRKSAKDLHDHTNLRTSKQAGNQASHSDDSRAMQDNTTPFMIN